MSRSRIRRGSILTLDVGGTHIKMLLEGQSTPRKIASGSRFTPRMLVRQVRSRTADWHYEYIAMGYPGVVWRGRPFSEPHNLGRGWAGFDFERAFGRPVRIVNDAVMQAIGSYEGGRMLFLGLGTGLGSALILDHTIEAMEIAHLPYKKGRTYEDYLGKQGLRRLGGKKWRHAVRDVVERLSAAFEVDYVVLGGGNANRLHRLPRGARLGSNANAFTGGYRLWRDPEWFLPTVPRVANRRRVRR